MNAPLTHPLPTPAPTRPRRRRWLAVVACAGVLLAALPGGWWYLEWSAERDYQEALAETDRLDPGWRFEDMQAARKPIPDAENAALQVEKVYAALGGGTFFNEKVESHVWGIPHNVRFNAAAEAALRRYLDGQAKARAEARRLAEMPNSRIPVTYKLESWDVPGLDFV